MNLNDPSQRLIWYQSLNRFPSPKSWQDLASQFGIKEVWLVDDKRLDRSYIDHVHQVIHINARCEYWRNYIIFGAQSPEESRLLSFLHELGHRAQGHSGSAVVKLDDSGNINLIINDNFLPPDELAAWSWAIHFKNTNCTIYNTMLNEYIRWTKEHVFKNKTW